METPHEQSGAPPRPHRQPLLTQAPVRLPVLLLRGNRQRRQHPHPREEEEEEEEEEERQEQEQQQEGCRLMLLAKEGMLARRGKGGEKMMPKESPTLETRRRARP